MDSPKNARKGGVLQDNAIAKKALEMINQIESEAKEKKMAQLESLQSAKAAIHERLLVPSCSARWSIKPPLIGATK